jgi:phage gp29-like protein
VKKPRADRPAAAESDASRKNIPAQGRVLFAHARNDITIPHYGTALRPTDDVLIRRGKGVELYREVLRDGRAYTVLQKRARALIARDWKVEPASEEPVDVRAAEFVERQLQRLPFDQITLGMLDATLMGFSPSETVWERDGFEVVPRLVKKIDQRRIVFNIDWQPRLLTMENMLDGLPFPERKLMVHRFDEHDGSDPYGFGLGRILFWHVLFKREGVGFWLKALERFATPIPVAEYPFGTLPEDQKRLLDALSGSITGGALAVPAGTKIEFAKAALSGQVTHEGWSRYWDEQTAEAVLGETLTTNIGSNGSKAAAETHKDVKDELIDGDADLVGASLQDQLIRWMVEYNFPDAQPPLILRPRSSNVIAEETAKLKKAERQTKDLDNLFRMRREGFAPEKIEETLTEIMERPIIVCEPVEPVVDPLKIGKPGADGTPAFAGPGDPSIVDRFGAASAAIRRGWIERIRTTIDGLLAEGGELADLPQRLLETYPDLETDSLAELIGDAFALAELKGRSDILDEVAE